MLIKGCNFSGGGSLLFDAAALGSPEITLMPSLAILFLGNRERISSYKPFASSEKPLLIFF